MTETPSSLKTVAIVQIVSGAVNLLLLWWLLGGVIGTVGTVGGGLVSGVCTGGICPTYCCGMCGFANMLLIPIGLFEIVSGILGLTNPKGSGLVMKIASFVEMGAILVGGLGSLIAGILAFRALSDPEVQDFLTSP